MKKFLEILKTKVPSKWLLILIAIFFVMGLALAGVYYSFEYRYQDRIYPGVRIGNLDLGGKTREEAKGLLNQRIDLFKEEGLVFHYHDQSFSFFPLVSSMESDLAYQTVIFDVEQTVDALMDFGRNGSFVINLQKKYDALSDGVNLSAEYELNEEELGNFLLENFSRFESPAQDARLVIDTGQDPVGISVEEEKYGQIIEYGQAINLFKKQAALLDVSLIEMKASIDFPKILKRNSLNAEAQTRDLLDLVPITLSYGDKQWQVDQKNFIPWLKLNADEQDKVAVGLDQAGVMEYLEKNISPDINREAIDAKFEMKDGRVVEFQASEDGLEVDLPATFLAIRDSVDLSSSTSKLVVREAKSALNTGEINDLGIKELIGTGHSSFAGSPRNRRHNIAVGAGSVNGTIVKPGEEFSLLKVLGNIDAKSGYLPELVIKGNRTIPEYGGGLCQIGTTVFRAALQSGMEITMRRNHSYRVSYYEPAGTDATIYNPWPDFRFKNNYDHHILIQSRIEGDDIYFDVWGTKDGRQIEITDPTIYNIVKPGPTKIIETADLAPGQKKCTEQAHNGADAYFDYKVTYTDGEVAEKRFSSHYVPWQAVCLVGIDPNAKKEDTASTTTPAQAN